MKKLFARIQKQRGGVTLLVLVMLIVFIIIITASLQFISRQSKQTVDQEQEEQSFGLADAGVQYIGWLLSPNGGNKTPLDLFNEPPASAVNHPIEKDGEVVGSFAVQFVEADDPTQTYLKIRSTGRDVNKPELCQVVEATFTRFADSFYRVTEWDHLVGFPCEQQISGCTPYPLTLGQVVQGQLTSDDCQASLFGDDVADIYTFMGAVDDVVQFNVTSNAFAPYITLLGPSGEISFEAVSAPVSQLASILQRLAAIIPAWAGTDSCNSGGACIAADGQGVTLPDDGLYQLEVTTATGKLGSRGAYSLAFNDPTSLAACDNDQDDDGDGVKDLADFSCDGPADDDEANPKSECQDDEDNDNDGLPDELDPGCWTDPNDSNTYFSQRNDESVATADPCAPVPIAFGGTASGTLDSADCNTTQWPGGYVDLYTFSGTTGQQVQIFMQATSGGDFTYPYLFLTRSDGSYIDEQSYCTSGSDACIPYDMQSGGTVTLPANDTYTIDATAYEGYTFDYDLTLTEYVPPPPPTNDNFASALSVASVPYTVSTSTVTATTETGEPQPCAGIGATLWYSYTPSASGSITADTFGSGYDTGLAVYTGSSLPSLVNIACNDDAGGLQSQVTFSATAGTTYHFQVGGYFGSTGSLQFVIN